MTGNPLSGHTKANESTMAGSGTFTDGLTDGDHIQSPTLTNYLEGIHGNGILLEEDTAFGATNKNVPEDLPGVCEQVTNVNRVRVTGGTAIIGGVPHEFAGGPGGTINIDLTRTSPNRRATYSALTSGQEALIVVYVSTKNSETEGAVSNVQWEMGTPITTATNAYPITPSAFLTDPKAATSLGTNSKSFQSVVLAVLRVVYNDTSGGGDLDLAITESNDKRVFIRPSPIYFTPVTSGAVGAVNAPVDDHAEIDALVAGTTGDLAGSRLGALWQSHGAQLGSTTAPDNEKDVLYYTGTHAARFTRSVFDRVLTSTATSLTLKSTDANILLLTPGSSATVTTSGPFPAGYVIELRNLHASNAVVFSRAGNYSVAGGTLTRFVCTTSHATTPVFSVLSDDSIETVQVADNAITLAKMDGIARGKIIVGDASGDPSYLAAGANGKLLVADANGDPSWTTVSGDVTISAGAVTIGNDKIDSQHYADGSIDTAHVGDDQITYAKIQNVSATDRILGRDSASAGVIEEITPANVRTMLNVADGATAYNDAAAIAAVEGESTLVLQSGVTVGTDLKLTTSSDDAIIENVTQDKDIIFQVNDGGSANTEVMRVDGSTSRVGIGATAPTAKLEVAGDVDISRSSDSGQTRTLSIEGARNATGTDYARIDLENYDSNSGSPATYVGARIAAINEATGVDDGSLVLSTANAGTLAERMRIKDSGEVVIGTDLQLSTSSDDVIIENVTQDKDIIFKVNDGGASTEVLRLDGSTGRVGIGGIDSTPDAKLHITSDGSSLPRVLIQNYNDDAEESVLTFKKTPDDGSAADSDDIGIIRFEAKNSNNDNHLFAYIATDARYVTDATEGGRMQFYISHKGDSSASANKRLLLLQGHESASQYGSVHINDGNANVDFIVDGDSVDSLIRTDGSADKVAIGTASVDSNCLLTVEGAISLDEISAPTNTADRGQLYTNADNELHMIDGAGTDVVFRKSGKHTIWVPASAMYPNTTNGCSALTQVELSNGPELKVLDFDDGSDEFAQFTVAFPKSWNEGTVTFQPFWTISATGTNTVAWQLAGVGFGDSDDINTAFGTAVATSAKAHSGTSGDMMVSAESGAVTISGASVDSVTYFQINRDTSADNHASDARLVGVKIFYTIDAGNDA